MAGVSVHRVTQWIGRVVVAANIGLGVLIQVRRQAPIGALGDVAFSIVWAVPAWLTVLAARDRQVLLVPGALLALLFALATNGPVGIGFFIEAMLIVGAWFVWEDAPPSRASALVVLATTLVFSVGAAFALFSTEDTRCYREVGASDRLVRVAPARCRHGADDEPPKGYRDTNAITRGEAVFGVGMLGLALGAGWVLAAPRATTATTRAR
jgi:hypothetical protein